MTAWYVYVSVNLRSGKAVEAQTILRTETQAFPWELQKFHLFFAEENGFPSSITVVVMEMNRMINIKIQF